MNAGALKEDILATYQTLYENMILQQNAYETSLNSTGTLWGGELDENQVTWMKYIERAMSLIINRSQALISLMEFMEIGEMANEIYLFPRLTIMQDFNIPARIMINYLSSFDVNTIIQWHDSTKSLMYKNYNSLIGDDFRTFFDDLENQFIPLSEMAIEAIGNNFEMDFPSLEEDHAFICQKIIEAETVKNNIKELIESLNEITERIVGLKMRMAYDMLSGDNSSSAEYNEKVAVLLVKIRELITEVDTLRVIGKEINQIIDEYDKKQHNLLRDVAWYFQFHDWIDIDAISIS